MAINTNLFDLQRHYSAYVSAALDASRAYEAFENAKSFYARGFVSEEKVRAAEDAYLKAKAEADRLYNKSWSDTEPVQTARWQPYQ